MNSGSDLVCLVPSMLSVCCQQECYISNDFWNHFMGVSKADTTIKLYGYITHTGVL